MDRIPTDQCKRGRVYRLRSRNLKYGVYDGNEGFVGIRTKFGQRFLFTEYHWDQGPPYGTVSGIEDTGTDLPDGLEPIERFESSGNPELFKFLEKVENET